MKVLEEYPKKRQRQLHELRVTMIHVMAVGNDVILCHTFTYINLEDYNE